MFDPLRVQKHSSVKIDHEILSLVIFSHLLIQEGQLSVYGNRMYKTTGYPLRGLSPPRKSVAM